MGMTRRDWLKGGAVAAVAGATAPFAAQADANTFWNQHRRPIGSTMTDVPSATLAAGGKILQPAREVPVYRTCDVLVVGGGSAGLMLLQLVKKRMPSVLAISEPIAYKRNLALKLGADYVINPASENVEEASLDLTNGLGFDVVIDASGAVAALENVTELIARGGKLMLFSYYHIDEALRLNLMETYWKELTVLSSYGAVESYYTTAASKVIQYLDIESLISEVIPFEEMQTALELFGTREKLRLIIEY